MEIAGTLISIARDLLRTMVPVRLTSGFLVLGWLLAAGAAASDWPPGPCDPSAEVRLALEKVAAATSPDAFVDQKIVPVRELLDRYPSDVFVHSRYQDIVQSEGTEGQLEALTVEYGRLSAAHPDDWLARYLLARAMTGRNTLRALEILREVEVRHEDFAPIHRTLAEIAGSVAFRNAEQERLERELYLSACPGQTIAPRPSPPPPEPSGFFAKPVGRLDDPHLPERIYGALRHDELRMERIRPFDWYSREAKLAATDQLQSEYWNAWHLLARHYRKRGQRDAAEQLIAEMHGRWERLRGRPEADVFWIAGAKLVDLDARGEHADRARATLADLEAAVSKALNPDHAQVVEALRAALPSSDAPLNSVKRRSVTRSELR